MSKQRDEILKIINNSKEHLTAEEIFLLCKQGGIEISMATIYRNLSILVKNGAVKKLSIIGEPDRYDKNLTTHEHFICSRCKKVIDIHIDDLKEVLTKKTGIDIDSYDLCMHYICPECKNKEGNYE